MKFRIASDLHLEFYKLDETRTTTDGKFINDKIMLPVMEDEKEQVLLLAGDIVMAKTCQKYRQFFKNISERFKSVVIVMGNHEHYRFRFTRTYDKIAGFLLEFDNIILAENSIIEFEDDPEVALFGATMWTDFGGQNPNWFSIEYAKQGMSDFNVIYADDAKERIFTPEASVAEHNTTRQKLYEFMALHKHKKKIVMTHHAPSFRSSEQRFLGSPLNPAFASDMDEFVRELDPLVWVHGHMHNTSDYLIGNTRIICNPYAYHNENQHYDGQKVIDI